MSQGDIPDDTDVDGATQSASSSQLTRRRLMQAVGGSLLGSAVLGNTADLSQAALTDGSTPSPGSVDWSEYIEDPLVVGENVEPPRAPTTMPYESLSAARDAERRREFTVPDGWAANRQTFLTVGAAKAGYFVWVNDSYVGYKQGSTENGANVIQDEWTSSDYQEWKFNPL